MAATKYTYSLSADTVNGKVNNKLGDEIGSSTITIAFDYIETLGDVLDVYMKDIMPDDIAGASASLLAIVNAHDGVAIEIIAPTDPENAPIVRAKAAPTGWTYQMQAIEFKTCTKDSVENKGQDGADRGFATLKFYELVASVETLITGANAADQTYLDNNCIRTDVDWEPTYDYEVLGGFISSYDLLTTDARLWVVGVPDVPFANGGEKEMCGGVNLRYLDAKAQLNVDGKVTKRLTYDATYHTNKLRFMVRHTAGTAINIQALVEHFKS